MPAANEDLIKYKKAAEQLPMMVEKRTKELNDVVEQQNREITLLKEMIRSLKITAAPPGARKSSKVGINVSDKKANPAFLPPLHSPIHSPNNVLSSNNYSSPNIISSPSNFNDMGSPSRRDSLNAFGGRSGSKSNLLVQEENINKEDIIQIPKSPSNFLVPAPPRKSLAQLPKVFAGRNHSHSKSNLHDDVELSQNYDGFDQNTSHGDINPADASTDDVQQPDQDNYDEFENDNDKQNPDEEINFTSKSNVDNTMDELAPRADNDQNLESSSNNLGDSINFVNTEEIENSKELTPAEADNTDQQNESSKDALEPNAEIIEHENEPLANDPDLNDEYEPTVEDAGLTADPIIESTDQFEEKVSND